jgi:hypothetical protein
MIVVEKSRRLERACHPIAEKRDGSSDISSRQAQWSEGLTSFVSLIVVLVVFV